MNLVAVDGRYIFRQWSLVKIYFLLITNKRSDSIGYDETEFLNS
jgi:hypothetical protein